ncbi:MAG: hypothetical protein RBG13Loki_0587 [Promethearchaeota archaeon CR_4]|nr:MAG: hypothetical protein RBG13Loki_0587 [Candidatus Lokiarchaeota archaeon CR_4]
MLATDTSGKSYEWVASTSWADNVTLNVPIDRVAPGTFTYTIEYTDDQGVAGPSDSVIVSVSGITNDFLVLLLIAVGVIAVTCIVVLWVLLHRKIVRLEEGQAGRKR